VRNSHIFQVGKDRDHETIIKVSEELFRGELSLGVIHIKEELIEKDQRSLLIIGGIEVFLPHSPVEARTCVADATGEKGQPTVIVMEEEENMEQTLMFSPVEGDENSEEWLK
jgi:hypothetical protein